MSHGRRFHYLGKRLLFPKPSRSEGVRDSLLSGPGFSITSPDTSTSCEAKKRLKILSERCTFQPSGTDIVLNFDLVTLQIDRSSSASVNSKWLQTQIKSLKRQFRRTVNGTAEKYENKKIKHGRAINEVCTSRHVMRKTKIAEGVL